MDKKIISGIIVIIAAVAVISLFHVFYVADFTYTDERISVTVPAGTSFDVKAEDSGSGYSKIVYNDTSDKDIVIKLMAIPDTNILGVSVKDMALKLQEDALKNESYVSVKITENYTIYKNNGTGRYNALIKNPGFNGFVLIGCNGDLDDITKLAESFRFKSYTTEGLTVEKTNTSSNNATVNNTSTAPNTSTGKQSTKEYIYLDEGEEAPYHPGWTKQDYIDAGYRFSDPNGIG